MGIDEIVVLGAGGFAREVVNLIEDINCRGSRWKVMGYADKDGASFGQAAGAHKVVISEDELIRTGMAVAAGIGDPGVLWALRNKLETIDEQRKPNLVHPSVLWNPACVSLDLGNVICAGNVLTVDIALGSFNIVNLSCTVGHDVVIEDCCVINPGCNISGGVTIGSRVLIGTGARILQGLKIGADAQVGAGAVVTKDVEPGATVIGVPARPLVRKG